MGNLWKLAIFMMMMMRMTTTTTTMMMNHPYPFLSGLFSESFSTMFSFLFGWDFQGGLNIC
jgi:uncharacterized membrane protein YeiB